MFVPEKLYNCVFGLTHYLLHPLRERGNEKKGLQNLRFAAPYISHIKGCDETPIIRV